MIARTDKVILFQNPNPNERRREGGREEEGEEERRGERTPFHSQ